MKILVSACLLGENCKYNGGNNFSEAVNDFVKGHEVMSLCPEVLGGLPVPRVPAEIVNGVVTRCDGVVVDAEFRKGAELALKTALMENVELAVLQSRSPSCGCRQVYDGSFQKKLVDGMGVFAQLLNENGIKVIDSEEL